MAEPNITTQAAAPQTANAIGPDDAPVGDLTSMVASSGVGTLLCATRMRMGRDLQRVAEVLHIRYTYLVAIEDGRYEDLPGQAYAIGFVRSYAELLGLDGNEVVRRYKEESAGVKRKVSFEFPIPTPDSGVPSGTLLLLAVVFGMSVYGIWYAIAGSDRSTVQLIQEVPSRLTALLDGNSTSSATAEIVGTDLAGPGISVLQSDAGRGGEGDEQTQVMSAEDNAAKPDDSQIAAVEATVEDTEELRPPPEVRTSAPSASPAETPKPPAAAKVTENRPAEDRNVEVAATPNATPSTTQTPAAATVQTPKPVIAAPEPAKPAAKDAPSSPRAESRTVSDDASETDEAAPAQPPGANSGAESEQTASADGPAAADVVELRAKADSWIQLRDGEELLLTRLLRKGETFRVPERGGLTLMTGNAGGLEVLVNGKVMPPIGNEGTVARGVRLDPKGLQGGG